MTLKCLRITHRPTKTVLADGPAGVWDIFEFDGGYYIPWRYVRATGAFRPNFLPGLCPYKGLYVGMNLRLTGGRGARNLGWLYWLPNPLLPFVWYRLVLPVGHPDLSVEEREATPARAELQSAELQGRCAELERKGSGLTNGPAHGE